MPNFEPETVIWVDLGFSYGWWPAVIAGKKEPENPEESSKKSKPDSDIADNNTGEPEKPVRPKPKKREVEESEWLQEIHEEDDKENKNLAKSSKENREKNQQKDLTIFDICPNFTAKKPEPNITLSEIRRAVHVSNKPADPVVRVRFFDDLKGQTYGMPNNDQRIKRFSCPDKIETIKSGLKKFEILKLADR